MRQLFALFAVSLALPAAAEKTAVLAVAEPFGGPGPALAQMSRDLQAAAAERVPGVLDPAEVRGRMLGQGNRATLPQLERAYAASTAMFKSGEQEVALRTLSGMVDDLDGLPESAENFALWGRAMLRRAYVEQELGRAEEAAQSLERVLSIDRKADPAQEKEKYPLAFLQNVERVRQELTGRPRVKLTVNATGRKATVFVNGRPLGDAPTTITLPRGHYRVSGLAGKLRVPSVMVDLKNDAEVVNLDFALADTFRPDGGPGLALGRSERAIGILRAGTWLGVDRVLVATTAKDGTVEYLVGSVYEVARGALVREGRVRIGGGGAPAVMLSTLVRFLLLGERTGVVPAGGAATPDNAVIDTTPSPGAKVKPSHRG